MGLKGKIIGLAAVAAGVSTLAACGSSGGSTSGEVTGKYMCLDMDMGSIGHVAGTGEYLEIKDDSNCVLYLLYDEMPLTYTIDGDNITIDGGTVEYTGTVKDDVAAIDIFGVTYTFAKEGTSAYESVSKEAAENQ